MTERPIDNLGRIVIPKTMREKLGLKPGSKCRVTVKGNEVRIASTEKICIVCGKTAEIELAEDKWICKSCANKTAENSSK